MSHQWWHTLNIMLMSVGVNKVLRRVSRVKWLLDWVRELYILKLRGKSSRNSQPWSTTACTRHFTLTWNFRRYSNTYTIEPRDSQIGGAAKIIWLYRGLVITGFTKKSIYLMKSVNLYFLYHRFCIMWCFGSYTCRKCICLGEFHQLIGQFWIFIENLNDFSD